MQRSGDVHDYRDVGGRATQEQLPRMYCIPRLHGYRRYDYMEVIGRVESGTETENDSGRI